MLGSYTRVSTVVGVFLANQKARNAIVGAENLLNWDSIGPRS